MKYKKTASLIVIMVMTFVSSIICFKPLAANNLSSYNNSINESLAVCKNGKTYYSNYNDHNYLYVTDNKKLNKKVTSHAASNIILNNNWLYFISKNSIYKIKTTGDGLTKIRDGNQDKSYIAVNLKKFDFDKSFYDEYNKDTNHYGKIDALNSLFIVGNKIYYSGVASIPADDGLGYIASIDINGKNPKLIKNTQGNPYEIFSVSNNSIYYNGSYHLGGIYSISINDKNCSLISKAFADCPNLVKNNIYYFDSWDENTGIIQKLNLSNKKCISLKVSKDYLNSINIYNNKIYFTASNTLNTCDLNGKNIKKIYTAKGYANLSNINITCGSIYGVGSNENVYKLLKVK